jgi:acyl carrier protein
MILEKIKRIFEQDFEIDPSEVTPEADILADLGLDEIDIYDMVMSVEDVFEMELPDEELEKIRTIGDIIKFVENNK